MGVKKKPKKQSKESKDDKKEAKKQSKQDKKEAKKESEGDKIGDYRSDSSEIEKERKATKEGNAKKEEKKNIENDGSKAVGSTDEGVTTLTALDIQTEEDENQLLKVIKRERKRLESELKNISVDVLEKKCDMLATEFSISAPILDKKREEVAKLEGQKGKIKNYRRAVLELNTFVRKRNQRLAELYITSQAIGAQDRYFAADPQGRVEASIQETARKAHEANVLGQALLHEEEKARAQELAKQQKKKVFHFILIYNIYNL